jgi:hypothetical protein
MKYLYILIGLVFLGIGYVGIFLPGVPTTFPAIVALWFFSKSSRRLAHWLRYNRLFGPYVRNWESKRIIPKSGKIAMSVMLAFSTVVFFTRFSTVAGTLFLFLAISLVLWSLPYPENTAEYEVLYRQGRNKFGLLERRREI